MLSGPGPDWRARRISTAVLPLVHAAGPPGYVHSVFARAVNLVLDGQLVTVADPSVGGLPNGIVLDGRLEVGLGLGLAAHATVERDGQRLWFGSHGPRLDLRGGVAWSPRLPARAEPPPALDNTLRRVLDQVPATGGFAPILRQLHELTQPTQLSSQPVPLPPLCRRAWPPIARLAAASAANDLDGLLAAADRLVGLGDGLTPSGDDLLVGCSAALRATAHPLAEPFALGCAHLAHGRTTSVAEMFLAHAARGAYSERIHDLVRGQLAATLGWGASSGADTLLGFLLGSAARPRPATASSSR